MVATTIQKSKPRRRRKAKSDFVGATKTNPCQICGSPDWCGATRDGKTAVCMRVESDRPSENEGWVHSLLDHQSEWAESQSEYEANLTASRRKRLADDLGLPNSLLKGASIGWDGIAFTFPEIDGDRNTTAILKRQSDGSKRVDKGGRRGFYLCDDADLSGTVFVVEGPTDVLAVRSIGVDAIGRPQATIGQSQTENLGRLLQHTARIVVLGEFDPKPDGSWPGRDGAIRTAQQLSAELGRPVEYAFPPEQAKDLRAFVVENNRLKPATLRSRLLNHIDTTVTSIDESEETMIVPLAQALNWTPPNPLIDNFVDQKSLSLICGAQNVGKSFLAIDWMFHVAFGLPWLGNDVEQGSVLYVVGEGHTGIPVRLRAWLKHHKKDIPSNVFLTRTATQLANERNVYRLLDNLGPVPNLKLVVLDTLSRCMLGKEENSSNDMGKIVAGADRIIRATGACVLPIHHPPKSGEGTRGSNSLPGAVDSSFHLKANKATGTITVTNDKQRDRAAADPLAFELKQIDVGDGHSSCVLMPTEAKPAGDVRERVALEILKSDFSKTGARSEEWRKRCDIPKSSFSKLVKSLVDQGAIVKCGMTYTARQK